MTVVLAPGKYETVKGYATKYSTLGFWFLDAAPTSAIGVEAIKRDEFFVNEHNMLEKKI